MKKFFSSSLGRGLFWQVIGVLIGAGIIETIRAILPDYEPFGPFGFSEPAWVLGAFLGGLFFLGGNGAMSDWFKWARGIDTPEEHPTNRA